MTITYLIIFCILVSCTIGLLPLISQMVLYHNKGKHSWGVLVPVYNEVLKFKIAGLSPWLVLLYLVPVANVVVGIVANIKFIKAYDKSTGYAVAALFLPFIFYPMTAFPIESNEKVDKNGNRINKVIYAILTILFGGIGVNKFYAGKVKEGIISILFCWTMIPALLSMVEFVTVLTEKADKNGEIPVESTRRNNASFITGLVVFVLFVIGVAIPWASIFTKLTVFTDFNTWLSNVKIAGYRAFSNIIGAPAVQDATSGSTTGIIQAFGSWTITEVAILIYMLTAVIAISLKEFHVKEASKELLISFICGVVLSVIVVVAKTPAWVTTLVLMITTLLLLAFLVKKTKVNEIISTVTAGIKKSLPVAITVTLVTTVFIITLGSGLRIGNGIGVTILSWILSLTKGFNMLTTIIMIGVGSVMAPVFDYFANCVTILLTINYIDTNIYGLLAYLLSSVYYLVMIIAPTSLGLVAGLYYLDIPYNKWVKYIWKVVLALLLIVVVTATIIYVRV